MTETELLNRMSCPELMKWIAFSNIEPFGEIRADIRAAMIATVMANAWRGKNQSPFKITDFVLTFGNKPEQTMDEMKQILKSFTLAAGGKIIKG